ncbi:BON domain-containing protein [Phytohabitans sp. ZYX-F-186]|uniref:BON domain-containing protein n=1 Tax=Phytohabitans maris TaxID=3071409 RepID=A0ABU0ZKP4_9ACTN|nr:BON domain-containing protein [Phytohabitans sp. ZYX-F-186]MDQ7907618.1 BON domain-containing protein [Phytohabitans sp. ZYX-F-186]
MTIPWPDPDDGFFHHPQRGRPVEREEVDQAVAEGVVARLLGHDMTGDQNIGVVVQNRVAILAGVVDCLEVVILAGDLAWRSPGVVDVCNTLTVSDRV